MLSKIQPRYWALLTLCLWGGAILYFNLVRFTPYGMDEGGAMALLINWSVLEQIANPIVTLGMPDFRALLFIPLGIYWPGSIVAAKIFTLLVTFITAMFFYSWSKQKDDEETALIATGLLLITPLTIMQIDAIGVGPYLLFVFGLGMFVDHRHRSNERSINSWYFLQLLLVAKAVTLHPIGLAYPLALVWKWTKEPVDKERQTHIFIGLGITVFLILVMQAGWISLGWFSNPLFSLTNAIIGADPAGLGNIEQRWLPGLITLALAITILVLDWRFLISDLLGSALLFGISIGFLVADSAWAMLVVSLILYRGTPWLIKANTVIKSMNFIGQRGIVLGAIFILATLFMQADKMFSLQITNGVLSPTDELIQSMETTTKNADHSVRIASQWPARTMIAVKHAVLPLPPSAKNGESLLKMIKGVTYIMFDQNNPSNTDLARNFAEISGKTETISVQQGGVIIKIRDQETQPDHAGKAEPDKS